MAPGVPMGTWLEALHKYASDNIDAELIDDRKDLWAQTRDDARDGPDWMTLTPHAELRNYEKILVKDLQLDPKALEPFVVLVRRGEKGYSEACRVLHHGLKDKKRSGFGAYGLDRDSRSDCGPDDRDPDPAAKSKWFKTSLEDALEALDNQSRGRQNKGAKGWSKGKEAQGPDATSTSNSSANAWANYSGNLVTPSKQCASSSSTSTPPCPYKTGWRPS